MAPLHVGRETVAGLRGAPLRGGADRAGGRARTHRRDVVVVVRGARLQPPAPQRGFSASDSRYVTRDVRGADAPSGGGVGAAVAGDGAGFRNAGRTGVRLFRGLGVGGGGGCDEDGDAVAAFAGASGKERVHDDPRRLPRGHVERDERLRPGGGDAQPLAGEAGGAAFRAQAVDRFRRGVVCGGDGTVAGGFRAARGDAGGVYPGADRTGGGGYVVLPPGVPQRNCGVVPGVRRTAGGGRDRDGFRADRTDVRLRMGGGGAGHSVRGQSADGGAT